MLTCILGYLFSNTWRLQCGAFLSMYDVGQSTTTIQSMCSSLFFKFQFTCGGLQGWFSCRNFCSLSKDSLLGMRVAMIPSSASRRCRGSGGTSCCASWSLGLCSSATGPSVDTWDAPVLARLGVVCCLCLTPPELPLGLRVGVASAAVTCSACYKRVRYI